MRKSVGKSRKHRPVALAAALSLCAAALAAPAVQAQTLEDALAQTYRSNPDLRAARAALRVVDEEAPRARSGWRPTVSTVFTGGGIYAHGRLNAKAPTVTNRSLPTTARLTVTQPLYLGGRVEARARRADSRIQAQRARLFETEQNVLLAAATAYVNAIRDESELRLRVNNLERLRKQLEATRDRFAVGEVTRTDVAQAESRVARAEADRVRAGGSLVSSRVVFERVVGAPPVELAQPPLPGGLPESREETVELAIANNFALVAARFEEEGAIAYISEVEGEFLPTVSLVGQASRSHDTSGLDNESTTLAVEAQLRVPIYQGGGVSARARAAKEDANRRRIMVESTRRAAADTAARAFEALVTARARTRSLEAEEASARVALEGVEQEATVGARTVLDVLDAEQALLDAQVRRVRAERDAFVAAKQLLVSVGRLTAAELALPVEIYDFDSHYRAVRDKAHGLDTPGAGP